MKRAVVLLVLASFSPGCAEPQPDAVTEAKPSATKPTVEGRRTRRMKEGHVLFSAERADLKTEVLPMIATQTGVTVFWFGEPR